ASCDITARMSVTAACGCCWAGSRDVSCAAGQQRPEEAVTDLDRCGGIRSRSLILSCHDKEDAEWLLHVAAQPPRTRHGTPASPQVNTQTVTVVSGRTRHVFNAFNFIPQEPDVPAVVVPLAVSCGAASFSRFAARFGVEFLH